jgi:hypothetical protein
MVVYPRALARPPDEADDGETLPRIAVQEILPITLVKLLRKRVRQSVVVAHQICKQISTGLQYARLIITRALNQPHEVVDESAETSEILHGVTSGSMVFRRGNKRATQVLAWRPRTAMWPYNYRHADSDIGLE